MTDHEHDDTHARDRFAAAAMHAIISNERLLTAYQYRGGQAQAAEREVAIDAYRYADAMMEIRRRGLLRDDQRG